jgi:putative ABC transport system ATP-binding protein
MSLIALQQITKTYELGGAAVPALRGVDLVVEPGEFTVITGPSGSGKSTLLHILGCLDQPSSGSYRLDGEAIDGRDLDELAGVRNEKIGFIFQSFNLVPVLDVLENVELPCLIGPKPLPAAEARKRAIALVERVGLSHVASHRPDQLSGGQRQRVAIARALVTKPALVLADEPTANLDSATSQQIIDLMLALNRDDGVTFLFSTHDHRVEKHARRIVSIADGVLHEERAPLSAGASA